MEVKVMIFVTCHLSPSAWFLGSVQQYDTLVAMVTLTNAYISNCYLYNDYEVCYNYISSPHVCYQRASEKKILQYEMSKNDIFFFA